MYNFPDENSMYNFFCKNLMYNFPELELNVQLFWWELNV